MAGKDETTPHEIVHGTEGKATLEHTQHEAPMPKIEKGDGIITSSLHLHQTLIQAPGIDLSSSSSSSKPHGSSGPTSHDKSLSSKPSSRDTASHSSKDTTSSPSHSTSAAPSTGTAGSHGTYAEVVREGAHSDQHDAPQHEGLTSSTKKEQVMGGKTTKLPSSLAASDNEPSHGSSDGNKFDEMDRDNAEKFGGVNLEGEGKTGHGNSSSGGSHEKKSGSGSGHEQHHHHETKKEGSQRGDTKSESEGDKSEGAGNKYDQADRDNAEKFGGVNLSNE